MDLLKKIAFLVTTSIKAKNQMKSIISRFERIVSNNKNFYNLSKIKPIKNLEQIGSFLKLETTVQ